jgi:hypothetical protein
VREGGTAIPVESGNTPVERKVSSPILLFRGVFEELNSLTIQAVLGPAAPHQLPRLSSSRGRGAKTACNDSFFFFFSFAAKVAIGGELGMPYRKEEPSNSLLKSNTEASEDKQPGEHTNTAIIIFLFRLQNETENHRTMLTRVSE